MTRKTKRQIQYRYDKLAKRMDRETAHLSFVKTDHPAFQEIVGAGKQMIPFLLRDISGFKATPWRFETLWQIVKNNKLPAIEAPEEKQGYLEAIRTICIKWGKSHGYLKRKKDKEREATTEVLQEKLDISPSNQKSDTSGVS